MYELESEASDLYEALKLLKRSRSKDIMRAATIIGRVARTLRLHDCDDYAIACLNCQHIALKTATDLPDVSECLELGMPALSEKYGYSSHEYRTAEQALSDLR